MGEVFGGVLKQDEPTTKQFSGHTADARPDRVRLLHAATADIMPHDNVPSIHECHDAECQHKHGNGPCNACNERCHRDSLAVVRESGCARTDVLQARA